MPCGPMILDELHDTECGCCGKYALQMSMDAKFLIHLKFIRSSFKRGICKSMLYVAGTTGQRSTVGMSLAIKNLGER